MLTRTKIRTLQPLNYAQINSSKPSSFTLTRATKTVLNNTLELTIVSEALLNAEWKATMQAEYDALMSNNTWTLVPHNSNMHLVGCKWIFKVKYNSYDTVQR